jgi:hypothetical protein
LAKEGCHDSNNLDQIPDLVIVAVLAAAYFALKIGGDSWLTRPIPGEVCQQVTQPEGVDFNSSFKEPNRVVSGIRIRPERGKQGPLCTQILSSFRCSMDIPGYVEVTYPHGTIVYDIKEGQDVVLFGRATYVFCTVVP